MGGTCGLSLGRMHCLLVSHIIPERLVLSQCIGCTAFWRHTSFLIGHRSTVAAAPAWCNAAKNAAWKLQHEQCSGSCMVQCSEKCSMKNAAWTMQRLLHDAMQRKMQHEQCSGSWMVQHSKKSVPFKRTKEEATWTVGINSPHEFRKHNHLALFKTYPYVDPAGRALTMPTLKIFLEWYKTVYSFSNEGGWVVARTGLFLYIYICLHRFISIYTYICSSGQPDVTRAIPHDHVVRAWTADTRWGYSPGGQPAL